MNKFKYLFIFVISVFGVVFSFDIPQPSWYVTDYANIFSQEEEVTLEEYLSNFEENTSVEIAVFTIDSTEGDDIWMLAVDVWEEWWVWKKWVDNWLLILIAKNDRKWFISVGYGLEWVITDALAKRIWESRFPGYFRDWMYFDWVFFGIQDLVWYINDDVTVVAKYNNSSYNFDALAKWFWPLVMAFLFLFVLSCAIIGCDVKKDTWKLFAVYGVLWVLLGLILFWITGIVLWSFFMSYLTGLLSFGILKSPWVGRWWWLVWWGFGGGWGFGGWFSSWWWSFGGFWGWGFGGWWAWGGW